MPERFSVFYIQLLGPLIFLSSRELRSRWKLKTSKRRKEERNEYIFWIKKYFLYYIRQK